MKLSFVALRLTSASIPPRAETAALLSSVTLKVKMLRTLSRAMLRRMLRPLSATLRTLRSAIAEAES